MAKSLEEQIFNKCIHFNGVGNNQCRAGIAYASFLPDATNKWRLPCWRDEPSNNSCGKAEFLTMEQAEQKAKEGRAKIEAYFQDIDADKCPTHGITITKKQVGRCVYAEPCGCRLYQGEVDNAQR